MVAVVALVIIGTVLLTRGGDDTPAASDGATSAPTSEASATPTEDDTAVPDESDATQPTETASPGDDGASTGTEDPDVASLAGTWATDDNFWVLRLTAAGTFVEDYDGVEEYRSGDFTLDGRDFTLVGGDGNETSGVLRGKNRLVFDDQVLVRQ